MTDEIVRLEDKVALDLRFLLDCLVEVLLEIGEPEVAAAVPWRDTVALPGLDLSVDRSCQLHSIAFQLLGMVEENAAVQIRRSIESSSGPAFERGLWGNTLHRLKSAGLSQAEIAAQLSKVHVEPVLTAHPTEAKRASVIAKHRAIYLLLVKRENPILTPEEQAHIRSEIKTLLEILWRTGNAYLERPEVQAERRNVLHYLKNVFPNALPILDRRLKAAWLDAGFSETTLQQTVLPRLTFGTWVGGDRDGHPLVTAAVTRESLQELRLTALSVIRHQLVELAEKLSLSNDLQKVPATLGQWIEARSDLLGTPGAQAVARNANEPWRQALNLVVASLPLAAIRDHVTTLDDACGCYTEPQAFIADLSVLDCSLREVGASRIADREISPLRRLVESIGFHLAVLDIRQNSTFHDRAVAQLLAAAGVEDCDFPSWSHDKRFAFLCRELASPRPFLLAGGRAGPEADAVLDCFRVVANHVQMYGASGVGALIVSMTRSSADLLVVYLLAREAGLLVYDTTGCRSLLPVVPLFETIDDLLAAPTILNQFLSHPVTHRTVAALAPKNARPLQQVMVGYSDSCKDGGILASHGALFRAQLELTDVGDRHDLDLRIFHGRGGSIGRGAGPTFRFLEALPPGSLRGSFRMTEQGETIAQKYSNVLTATYHLELQLAGVLGMTARGAGRRSSAPEFSAIMGLLVEASRHKYQELIGTDGFMEFFAQATPIDVMEQLRIGSRPARRTGRRTLADLRAIPWVFSWNQSRYLLPSWYGVGTALAKLREQHPEWFAAIHADLSQYPLLRYLLMNVELALLQADPQQMHAYAELVQDKAIRTTFVGRIDTEFALTTDLLQQLFVQPLAARRPAQLAAMQLRQAPLAALHAHQIYLLRQWRQAQQDHGSGDQALRLLGELFLTVNAIAGGIRNTG